jgi:hypothetical protein
MDNAFDFNHRPNISERISAAIDAAMQAENQAQPRREYLGASRLGEECARMLQYEFMGVPKSRQFSGETLRIFERGHAGEAAMARRLRLAGFDMLTETQRGGQFGFDTANGRIKGHCDGIITATPFGLGVPAIWEHKVLGAKGWNAVAKHGVAKEKPVYAGQIALLQAYLEGKYDLPLTKNPALFTAENADNGKIHAELVPFNSALAQECSDRGVLVLQATEAGETLPRPYPSDDFFKCKFCDFRLRCWT